MESAAEKAGGSWSVLQQLGVQATAVLVTILFATGVTLVLIIAVEQTIGLRLKEPAEMAGLDHCIHGEHGYGLINPN